MTNPSEWGVAGWLAHIIPLYLYGLFTAIAFDAFTHWQGLLVRRLNGS